MMSGLLLRVSPENAPFCSCCFLSCQFFSGGYFFRSAVISHTSTRPPAPCHTAVPWLFPPAGGPAPSKTLPAHPPSACIYSYPSPFPVSPLSSTVADGISIPVLSSLCFHPGIIQLIILFFPPSRCPLPIYPSQFATGHYQIFPPDVPALSIVTC